MMKRIQVLLGCVMLSTLLATAQKLVYQRRFAPSEGYVNRYEKACRDEICLNGYWDFQGMALPKDFKYGVGQAPILPQPASDGWDKVRIKIPSPWNINSFAYRNLEGPDHRNYPSYPKSWEDVKMAWMRKVVTVPSDWEGRNVKLHFEAVAGMAEVYVNGYKAGENFDLFLPFEVDVTPYVKPGEQIEILVGVRSQWLFEDRSTVGRRIVPGGSMWGYHVNGIWQDVYLLAVPRINIKDVFVQPMLDSNTLRAEVTIENTSGKDVSLSLSATVNEWINLAGTDVNTAPEPRWRQGQQVMQSNVKKIAVKAGNTQTITIEMPVAEGQLLTWTPEHPNLYALLLTARSGRQVIDIKYQRFGWRQWTIRGTTLQLNGEPYQLKSDSWHFQGVPQMTRRYAWAWYKAIKEMNGNAVRLHAQVYPRFYMEMADEMGICVLDETANWASDGGPKLDSELFWQHSRDHLRRFVERDRNYPSVFGWSISNENKPVILYVFKRPDLMPGQQRAWEEWRDIVKANDPTRPWISSDGEDDGDGLLPVTVGHYGDANTMLRWQQIGKPWGIGETGMCYYGTPQQVAKYNGQRAYESAEGRMEGLANECYHLIKKMREMGASYTTVFNMVWYGLKPLPFGKRDLTTPPTLQDGVFFDQYVEGLPGMQPERLGPYSSTLNPGYDPSLPLYQPWPLYDALRAANASPMAEWSPYATIDTLQYLPSPSVQSEKPFKSVVFIGSEDSNVKQVLDAQGVEWSKAVKKFDETLYIVDASAVLSKQTVEQVKTAYDRGASIWLWGLTPATVEVCRPLLRGRMDFDELHRSSFIPAQRSWMRGLKNDDFYFCEVQKEDAAGWTMKGEMIDEGQVLLEACKTDWRRWNLRPEELKTAALLRSENETWQSLVVMARCERLYVSTLNDFARTEKGFRTLAHILANIGLPMKQKRGSAAGAEGIDRDPTNLLLDPSVDTSKK